VLCCSRFAVLTVLSIQAKYPNALQRRAQAYEKQDKLQEALEGAWSRRRGPVVMVLRVRFQSVAGAGAEERKGDCRCVLARVCAPFLTFCSGVKRLEPEVARRQEKMKEEMLGACSARARDPVALLLLITPM
jgi:hypothetical protein